MTTHGSNRVRAVVWGLAATLLVAAPAAGQNFSVTARYGTGMTQDITDLTGTAGIEARYMVGRELAVTARGDTYQFGFVCAGLATCRNEATAVTVGAQFRPEIWSVASFYVGGDVGRAWWPGSMQSWIARPRVGVDLRIVGPVNASVEYGYTRFIHSAPSGERAPPPDFVGLSAGLSFRF